MNMNLTCTQHDLSHDPEIEKAAPFDDLQISFHAVQMEDLQPMSQFYQDWLALFEQDPHALLNHHPDYLLYLQPQLQKSFPDRPSYVMFCRHQDTLIAAGICCPKNLSTKILRGMGPARVLQGYYLKGNSFLLQQGYQDNSAFLEFLLETTLNFCQQHHGAFLFLEDVHLDSPVKACLDRLEGRCLIYSHTGYQPRSLIRFPENAADYWSQFRSKSRRKHRKMIRDNSHLKLVRITEPDQIADFLSAAHQVSKNSWQSQRLGLRVKNNDQEVSELMFYALHGALRSYLLMDGDRPVAFKISNQFQGVFNDLEFGFDLDYASDSPGETLLLLILEDLTENDSPRTYDFGEGDAQYKQRYSSELTHSGAILLLPKTLKNKNLLCYLNTSRWIDQTARNLLKTTGIYTGLRQLVRYGRLGSR